MGAVAGYINAISDVGYKSIPAKMEGWAKILDVPRSGRTTILISLSKFSNTAVVIALVTIYPIATALASPVSITYLQGAKSESGSAAQLYYVVNSDNSISLYSSTPAYEQCGYRVISNYRGVAEVSIVDSLPDGAILI